MNIAEILKDCPKGTKLYSPVYGEVKLLYLDYNSKYPIVTEIDNGCSISFTLFGRLYANHNGECMLFPSKDNRDWSTFKVPKKEYNFKPFDRVLVRDGYTSNVWSATLFSHKEGNRIITIDHETWEQCIPFEGNEQLLGTSCSINEIK